MYALGPTDLLTSCVSIMGHFFQRGVDQALSVYDIVSFMSYSVHTIVFRPGLPRFGIPVASDSRTVSGAAFGQLRSRVEWIQISTH